MQMVRNRLFPAVSSIARDARDVGQLCVRLRLMRHQALSATTTGYIFPFPSLRAIIDAAFSDAAAAVDGVLLLSGRAEEPQVVVLDGADAKLSRGASGHGKGLRIR